MFPAAFLPDLRGSLRSAVGKGEGKSAGFVDLLFCFTCLCHCSEKCLGPFVS